MAVEALVEDVEASRPEGDIVEATEAEVGASILTDFANHGVDWKV